MKTSSSIIVSYLEASIIVLEAEIEGLRMFPLNLNNQVQAGVKERAIKVIKAKISKIIKNDKK